MKKIHPLARLSFLLAMGVGVWSCQEAPPVQEDDIVYGPVQQSYELPENAGTIYYVAPDAQAESAGLSLDHPTTIETALTSAITGDAVIMRGGTYRTGNLTFNQGITIQPYKDEQPVLKGTLVATEWQQVADSIWFTAWNNLFPAGPEDWWVRERNEQFTPMHRFNNDGVFINGQYLQSVGSKNELDEGTFFVDYEANEIYIGANPTDKLVEITAFRKAIFRTIGEVYGRVSDGRGPVIKGLEITQYPDTMVHIDGYYPQGISAEAEHGKDVIGTVFENCTFSQAFRIGLFAIGDSLLMRNCKVENTNTEGVYIVASSDVLLERNIFAHNNIENWTGFFPAAVKIFNQTHRVVCRENLITNHPNSNGLWYDVGNEDGVFVNNWIEGVGSPKGPFRDDQVWPSSNGLFFEISSGVLVAGNVFVDNNQGMLILNSDDAEIYNNTFINSRASFGRDARGDDADHFGWHIRTGPGVDARDNHVFVNNLLVTTMEYPMPLLYVWQRADMCERLNMPTLKTFDNNVYVRHANPSNAALVLWSPFDNERCQAQIFSPSELTELYPQFETQSQYLSDYSEDLFTQLSDRKGSVAESFEGHKAAAPIPDHVRAAAGWSDTQDNFIGAR
jgi:parallel beta-helix repeat protein